MVFNVTFNNISVLLVEETRENHTLSHNVILSTPCLSVIRTHNIIGDRH
jgi:hypothetical protein